MGGPPRAPTEAPPHPRQQPHQPGSTQGILRPSCKWARLRGSGGAHGHSCHAHFLPNPLPSQEGLASAPPWGHRAPCRPSFLKS